MEEKPVIVIEHLEEQLGIWLFLEYRHSSQIYGEKYLWFTNLPSKYHRLLNRYGEVLDNSIVELINRNDIGSDEVIILDPKADRELSYNDLVIHRYIVIGGILGDHPPRGRTWKLLSNKLHNVETRNIGDGQYSIDGAVYYVDYLWRNRSMQGFRYVDGVYIETSEGEIYLPHRYPLVDDKPLLTPGLVEYLRENRLPRNILEEIGLSK